jgi:hypothetical protein
MTVVAEDFEIGEVVGAGNATVTASQRLDMIDLQTKLVASVLLSS